MRSVRALQFRPNWFRTEWPKVTELVMIGILGGMGPLASADLFMKITSLTPAGKDQEHIKVAVYSDPTIPDRTLAILNQDAASPLPQMIVGISALTELGAECIALACNTAHHWYDALSEAVPVPILHVAEAVCQELSMTCDKGRTIGILATEGTIVSGFYQRYLDSNGYKFSCLEPHELCRYLAPAIDHVKAGRPQEGKRYLDTSMDLLRSRGATTIVLACTELPLVADCSTLGIIDSSVALAKSCIQFEFSHRKDDQVSESFGSPRGLPRKNNAYV